LQAYVHAHPDTFRRERRFTFRQIYLNPERHRDSLERDTVQLLAALSQAGDQADVATLGDAFLLGHEFEAVADSEAATLFGEPFAAALGDLALGQWQGPVASGYGVHPVCVSARTEGCMPALEEVRDAVRREWANVQRQHAQELFYQVLLKRYAIVVQRP
jgi:parvulin-like peptidyl-prolyl cis-trans isomerase-like protein